MLNSLINYFINRKLLVLLLIIVIVITGIIAAIKLKRESMPEVDLYQLSYTTIYPGASPEDVELKITIPLEEAIKGVDDIKVITSKSFDSISSISIELEDYLSQDDADKVKADIQKAVDRVVDLPAEIRGRPKLFEVEMTNLPIIELALSHPDPEKLRKAANFLTRKLERLSDVSEIIKVGYLDKEVKIALDPYKLISTETPIDNVINTLRGRSIRMSGGKLESYESEKSIVADEELKDDHIIENVIIRASYGGKSLRIKDIADIQDTYIDPSLLVRSNGKPGISLAVVKKKQQDAIRAIKKVKELINKEKSLLPKDLQIDYVNDTSVFTQNRIRIVVFNAGIGFVLVFISLLFFLDFRTALWTAFGIPFSLLVSFIVLKEMNISINPLSLGGFIIVIGMLVDDAIVVAENINRHRESGDDPDKAVRQGVTEVAVPVLTTVSTTIVAFIPLMFMSGIMGKFMKVIPLVVIVTLCASLFDSLFFLPSHLKHGNTKKAKTLKKKVWMIALENSYAGFLNRIIRARYLVLLLIIFIFGFSVFFAMKNLKFELFPSGDEDTFYVKLEAPVGTSLDKMLDLTKKYEAAVASLPKNELYSFSSRIGSESNYTFETIGSHPHLAVIHVYLSPVEQRSRDAREIIKEIKEKTKRFNKKFTKVSFELKKQGPPTGKPIELRLVGDIDEERNKAGLEMFEYLKGLKGVNDPRTDLGEGKKEFRLIINYNKLAELGLNVYQLASTIRTAYAGTELFSVRRDNEDVTYTVIFDERFRSNPNYLLDLPIQNVVGKLIRLKKFARLEETNSVLEINRYNNQRAFWIYADLDQKVLTSMEASKKCIAFFRDNLEDKYPNVSLIAAGEAQTSNESVNDLKLAFGIAILGIYFILVLLFNSFLQPVFVLSAIPLGFIGIIWAFYFHGQSFSFPAVMGFIGLSGVVVNDSLIMVAYINKISETVKDKNEYFSKVVEGAKTRLRPVLLTTITTVLGLLPTVYGWGGTDFILVPMTMSLGYGLLFATLITLLVIPMIVTIHKDFNGIFSRSKK